MSKIFFFKPLISIFLLFFAVGCTNPVAQFRKVAGENGTFTINKDPHSDTASEPIPQPAPVTPPAPAEPTPTEPALPLEPTPTEPADPSDPSDPNPVPLPNPTPEPDPVAPVTPPTPVTRPQPIQKSGTCANNSSTQLLSCLSCLVPTAPAPAAQFSEKGQSLIEVMALGCSIPNKSAPKNYIPPTQAELLERLNRLSPALYPDSQKTTAQSELIQNLLSSSQFLEKMFNGSWYKPPYSTAFETYFGISLSEAVYSICYQSVNATFTPGNSSEIHSKEYLDCAYNIGSGCREKLDYVAANKYRNELRSAMIESTRNPYVKPLPSPAKSCYWESYAGLYEDGAEKVLRQWLKAGYKVGVEINSLAGRCELLTAVPKDAQIPRGEVKMSGYYCK